MPKVDDTTATCNMIAQNRLTHKKRQLRSYDKSITTRLSKENGRQLSQALRIFYDPKNNSITFAVCLRYFTRSIFPDISQKRTCTNAAGLAALEKGRANARRQRAEKAKSINAMRTIIM